MQVIVVGASVFAEDTDFTNRSFPSLVHDVIFLPRDKVVGAEAGFPGPDKSPTPSFLSDGNNSSLPSWISSAGDFTVDELDEVTRSRTPNKRSTPPTAECSLLLLVVVDDDEAPVLAAPPPPPPTILLLAPNLVNLFRHTVNGVLTPSINASLSSEDSSLSSCKSDEVLSLIRLG